MAAKPARGWPVPFGAGRRSARLAEREWPPNPRAASVRGRDARLFGPLRTVQGRKRLWRRLGLVGAGLAAIVYLAPLAWAGRLDPCAAAEAALVDEAVGRGSRFERSKKRVANWAGPDGKLLSRGRVGRQIAAEEHTGWPPPLGCTALFWRVRSEGVSSGGINLLRFAPAVARR